MENNIIRIFLASPSDTASERKIVKFVIDEVNQMLKDTKIRFEIVQWENMPPKMGRPQETVNQWAKIKDCNIFVGILWKKFGSKTGGTNDKGVLYESGTQEEFEQAYKAWKENKQPDILFFKSLKSVSTDNIDAAQISKVNDFFGDFNYDKSHPGIYQEYKSNKEFEKKIRLALVSYAINYISDISQENSKKIKNALDKYGIQNIYVPEMNNIRNESKVNSLNNSKNIYLIAHSGFSFVAQFGHRFRNIIEEKLNDGYEFKAILTNPWSESGFFISLSETEDMFKNDVINIIKKANWYKVKFQDSMNGYQQLMEKYNDKIQIRFTRFEIPSSILLTDDNCYIEPYLPINLEKRYENGMLTFELQLSNSSYLYQHNKDYFDFLWEISDDIDTYQKNITVYQEQLRNKFNKEN